MPPKFAETVGLPSKAWLMLLALLLVPYLMTLIAVVVTADGDPSIIGLATGLLAGIFVLVVLLLRPNRLLVDGNAVRLRAGLASLRRPLSALVPDSYRRIDLDEHPDMKPRWRVFGTAFPGLFWAGWFRLCDGRRAFLLLNRQDRVTCVETSDGVVLLLALEQPERLRRALGG